ncbi:hypothetical protein [Cryptosporangium aurantiacum]|uniref:Uncharacterized protein n=1 Tax=Cryptosporangium aurantiacum TaxID=134849 RepID=A0A1M7P9I4_9ACTN|nr:hypothetical protein [Cryptosporangium aurantiacum]SHN13422.1 hypothetical protein SAMN05443668_10394 [Cryptosporangium aurantiacum]
MTDRPDERELRAELAHWRGAVAALSDLDTVAAPAAWAMLEDYLRSRVRARLERSIAELAAQGSAIALALDLGEPLGRVRARLLGLRRDYVRVETVVDFYGDAVGSRTNARLGRVLGGLDTLACDSMEVILRPLGHEVPPALVYVDKGMGAAILRAGVRLWGPGGPSPVAAIKLTRHNLGHPTALFHETGHQVAAQTGWVPQLADALDAVAARHASVGADLWGGWAGEIAADVHAFVLAGWSPVPALARVVDGSPSVVHRIRVGDPHPPAWLRVMFNVALCRAVYGAGPWDDLSRTWLERHDPRRMDSAGARVAAAGLPMLPALAETCLVRRYPAFCGRAITALADPELVSPVALDALEHRIGPALLTSAHLARRRPMQLVALLTRDQPSDPTHAAAATRRLHDWLARLAPIPLPSAA